MPAKSSDDRVALYDRPIATNPVNGSNVGNENWAGSQLQHPIGCRAEDRQI